MDDDVVDVWEEFALDDTPAVAFDDADTPLAAPRRAATNSDWPPAPPTPRRASVRRAAVYNVAVIEPEIKFRS